ncbi:hypothetical protein V7S43_017844 [Phytophthora oleae]|uniref:Uncharacterized protein n=1 Tax=Phytophthora oleae TaxID=2107226 RepID=A0ABD3ESB5_9STRA
MELRRQRFDQQMQVQIRQHVDRIALEREMQNKKIEQEQVRALAPERAEERAQQLREQANERNRQLICESVKVLGEAFANAKKN